MFIKFVYLLKEPAFDLINFNITFLFSITLISAPFFIIIT